MTIQLSTACRNGLLDSLETTISTGPIFKLYSGAVPASCAASPTGTVLATITLASDWAANASGGSKAFANAPLSDTSADASGTAGYWRIYASNGTTCHMQGTFGLIASGADIEAASLTITAGQEVDINSWTLTAPGA